MELNDISLSELCRIERKKQSMNQTALAERCGMTLYRIHSLETGTGIVTFGEGLKILEALGYGTFLDGERLDTETAGQAVRNKRICKDLTQNEVAEKAGVSKSTVRKMEGNKPIRFENAEYILTVVGVKPEVVQRDKPRRNGDLSKLCRSIRAERGLTQRELADRAYVSWQTVQQFECGNIYPRIDTIEAIFKGLGYRIAIEEIE